MIDACSRRKLTLGTWEAVETFSSSTATTIAAAMAHSFKLAGRFHDLAASSCSAIQLRRAEGFDYTGLGEAGT